MLPFAVLEFCLTRQRPNGFAKKGYRWSERFLKISLRNHCIKCLKIEEIWPFHGYPFCGYPFWSCSTDQHLPECGRSCHSMARSLLDNESQGTSVDLLCLQALQPQRPDLPSEGPTRFPHCSVCECLKAFFDTRILQTHRHAVYQCLRGNRRSAVSSVLFLQRKTHWVLRQTWRVLRETRWVRVGTQMIGWEELAEFSPQRLVRVKKLTEFGVWNRALRNCVRPVSDLKKSPARRRS